METWTAYSSHLVLVRLQLLVSALSDMTEYSLLNPSRTGFYMSRWALCVHPSRLFLMIWLG